MADATTRVPLGVSGKSSLRSSSTIHTEQVKGRMMAQSDRLRGTVWKTLWWWWWWKSQARRAVRVHKTCCFTHTPHTPTPTHLQRREVDDGKLAHDGTTDGNEEEAVGEEAS